MSLLKKMDNIKVSVLVASYNNEKYLDECIESIKKQSYKNLEIIIFDDGSTDNSVLRLKKYNDIKIIENKNKINNHGSYCQINAYKKAFQISTGEIIFFLDSDDFFCKNKIKIIVNHFQNNIKDEIIFDLPIEKYSNKMIIKKNKVKYIKNFWPYIPPQSCISIKRKTLEQMFNFVDFEKFHNIWFDFRIAIFAKYILKNFVILEKNLTYYRKLNTAVTSNFTFLSKNWWSRRKEAHDFIKYFFVKNNIKYKKNIDYFLTHLINKII
jgi:glycosyltransferase involved in cell wall biosynthesis